MSEDDPSELIGTRVGRVRIEALLGSGGMGEVYQGWDDALERPVALKKLRRDKRTTPLDQERFLREARLLSRLDHPNVCRIYDLIEDARGRFLVLELIRGRTLHELLEEGELSRTRRLEIGCEVAAGLAAAHRERIVHRDVKPQNVMITEDGGVKLLDLGIARPALDNGGESSVLEHGKSSEVEEFADHAPTAVDETAVEVPLRLATPRRVAAGSATHTSLGSVVGTALYMSPEQARGEPVTEASDLYSLGLLLQVLLCDAPPHPGDLDPRRLLERVSSGVSESARGPHASVCRLIERLKSTAPGDRPSAAEAEQISRRLLERPRRQRFWAATILVMAGVVGATAWLTERLLQQPPILHSAGGRIAVAPFVNATGDEGSDWVEFGLAGMVAEALDAAADVAVVLPPEVHKALGEEAASPQRETGELRRLVERLDVAALMVTEVLETDTGYRLRSALVDRSGRQQLQEVQGTDLTSLADQLRGTVAARLLQDDRRTDLRGAFSGDSFANRAYATGKQLLETDGARRAEPYFAVSLDRDASMLRAQLELGVCAQQLGRVEEAKGLLEEVVEKAAGLGDAGIQAQALFQLAGLAMGRTDHEEARRALQAALVLQQQRGDRAGQQRVEAQLGVLAYRLGELDNAQTTWSSLAEEAAAAGDRRLEMSIARNLGYVHVRLGERQAAARRFRRSLELARQLEDRDGQAYSLGSIGFLEIELGEFAEAERHLREATAICAETGNRRGQLTGLANLASASFAMGDLAAAVEYEREALAIARQLADRRVEAQSLAALGYYSSRRGRLDEADELLNEAAAVIAAVDDPEGGWLVDRNLAVLRALQGRLPEARRFLAAALERRRDKLVLVAAALVEYLSGHLAEAVRLQEEAEQAGGVGWTQEDQQRLELYRRAAQEGRPLPLPVDAP